MGGSVARATDGPSTRSQRRSAIALASGRRAVDAAPWALVAVATTAVAAKLVLGHWTPTGDDAMITAYSVDSWTADAPLVGMPTSLSIRTGSPVHHPGPLQFWWLGPPARLLGAPGYGVALGGLALNLILCLGTALSVQRLRPRLLRPFVAAVVLLVIVTGLGPTGVLAPFNSNPMVLACLCTATSAWAVLRGHRWWLPIHVAAASMAAQVHVTGLGTIVLLVVVTVAGSLVDTLRRPVDDPVRQGFLRRVLPVSFVVGVALWTGPILDQLTGSGNLLRLVDDGSSVDPVGWRFGVERMAASLGPRPLWTTTRAASDDPTLLAVAVTLALIGVLTTGAVSGLRRRDRDLLVPGVIGLTVIAAGVLVTSRLPTDARALVSPTNRTVWWPLSAVAWMAAVAVLAHVVTLRRPRLAAPSWRATSIASLASAVLVVAVAVPFVDGTRPERTLGSLTWGQVRHHSTAIAARVPAGGTVRIQAPDTAIDSLTLVQSVVGQLRLGGYRVQIDVIDPWGYFAAYRNKHPDDREPDLIVYLRAHEQVPAPPGDASPISRWDTDSPTPAFANHTRQNVLGTTRGVSVAYEVPPDSSHARLTGP